MDRWLAAVETRRRATARSRRRSSRDRPADVHDRCSQIDGVEQVDVPGVGHGLRARRGPDQLRRRRARSPARASRPTPTSARSSRCGAADYYPITFTDDQWAQLQKAFPTGVCDWTQAGRRASTARSRGRPTRTRDGARDLRRPAARPGARRLGRRLDERRVRLLALLGGARLALTRASRGPPKRLPAPHVCALPSGADRAKTATAGKRHRRCGLRSA